MLKFVREGQRMIRAEQRVLDVIARYPATAQVFHAYGLDACCGGAHSIEIAARARGVALDFLLDELEKAAARA